MRIPICFHFPHFPVHTLRILNLTPVTSLSDKSDSFPWKPILPEEGELGAVRYSHVPAAPPLQVTLEQDGTTQIPPQLSRAHLTPEHGCSDRE